jgi:hypothetical protein
VAHADALRATRRALGRTASLSTGPGTSRSAG